jgi:hypothetical protein
MMSLKRDLTAAKVFLEQICSAWRQGLAGAPAASTPEITLGDSIDEVTAPLGQPRSVVDLGERRIYVYKVMRVVFKGGKVILLRGTGPEVQEVQDYVD